VLPVLRRLLPVAIAAAALGGCGGSSSHKQPDPSSAPPAASNGPRAKPARPADVAVIKRWSDSLRTGHPAVADRLFGIPAVVQNGTPPLELRSRRDVHTFNSSLPCGAVLIDTRVLGGYDVATFRLTDRPGSSCGPGSGQRAATAFRIRRGRIVEWRRVAVPDGKAPAPAPPANSKSV
jgi:hypothetical protein